MKRHGPHIVALWLLIAGMFSASMRANNHASVGGQTADTIATYRQRYGAMEGAALIDTAANRIAGNVAALDSLFARLLGLENLYDQLGRPGPEPYPGGGTEPADFDRAEEAAVRRETGEEPSAEEEGPDAGTATAALPEPERVTTSPGLLSVHAPGYDPGGSQSPTTIYTSPSCLSPEPFDPMRETIVVLHLGDSHLQGGSYPRQVRARLQYRFGNAGRGLLTPYRLMKTNQPTGYEISSPNSWTGSRCTELDPQQDAGPTGGAITTGEATIEFRIATPGDPFGRVTAFHHPEAPLLAAEPALTDDISCPRGDSPTMTRIPLRVETDQVVLRGNCANLPYNTPVYYGFSVENGRSGILYHAVGINGNTYWALNRNPQVVREAAQLAPDLIILSLGTNDSYGRYFDTDQVAGQLRRLIVLCRRHNPQARLLLTTPMESYSRVRSGGRTVRRVNPNTARVRETIIGIANGERIPYWDFYTAAGGEGAMEQWNLTGLARADHIHLTPEGYALQGEMLYQALLEAYIRYKTGT